MAHSNNILITPVFARKGKQVLSFDNISHAAKHFGVSTTYIKMHMMSGTSWRGYQFEKGDPRSDARNAKFYEQVVGISPTGEAVLFDSVIEVADTFRVNNCSVFKVLNKWTHTLYGWQFIYPREYNGKDFVPMTQELLETFQPTSSNAFISVPRRKQETKEEVYIDPYEGRTPIMTGYYDVTAGVSVCPVCGMVIANGYGAGTKHLLECLEPYEYDVKHFIVRVWGKKN